MSMKDWQRKFFLNGEKLLSFAQHWREKGGVTKELLSHPKQWVHLLEEQSPVAAKRILSLASGVMQPELLGRGLKVEEWSRQRVGLCLPYRKIEKLSLREVSVTSLLAMGEFAIKLYWDRHLQLSSSWLQIKKAEVELTQPVRQGISARLELDDAAREQILFAVNCHGVADFDLQILLLSESDQRLGHIQFTLSLRGARGLAGR